MYYTHPGCRTSIFGENRAYCIRDFTVSLFNTNNIHEQQNNHNSQNNNLYKTIGNIKLTKITDRHGVLYNIYSIQKAKKIHTNCG